MTLRIAAVCFVIGSKLTNVFKKLQMKIFTCMQFNTYAFFPRLESQFQSNARLLKAVSHQPNGRKNQ